MKSAITIRRADPSSSLEQFVGKELGRPDEHVTVARPFIKWAGGKTKLLPELLKRLPERFATYHEPCVGGGALFWSLAAKGSLRRAILSDTNGGLIDTYEAIRDSVQKVIDLLSQMHNTEAFFKELRAQDPAAMSLPERAARLVYLNKTCFNGLYRVNLSGQFNTPFGHYKSPNFCDEPNLTLCSAALRDSSIALSRASFESILNRAKPGDLAYFDPPYLPSSKTSDFTAYTPGGFGLEDHLKLRDVALELKGRGVNVMISNSDVPAIRELYEGRVGFYIDVVEARRDINSKGTGRGAVRELIIR